MASRKHKIIKDTVSYSFSQYATMFIGFFTSTFIKRFLGPLNAGYWALLNVIQSYVGYLGLGTKVALTREVPQAIGRGEPQKAREIEDTVFSYLLAISVIGAFAVFALSYFIFDEPFMRWASLFMGALIGFSHMYTLVLTILRARKDFTVIAKILVLNAVLVALFAVPLCYFFKIIGLICGLCISNYLCFYLSKKWTGTELELRFAPDILKKMIYIGVPMMGVGFLYTTFINIDRMMLAKMVSVKSLGYYTIALMASTQLETMPKFFNIVIFPHMQEKFGASGNLDSSKNLIFKSIYFTSRFLPLVLGAIIFFISMIVNLVLPQFIPGLPAMRILLFGFFFVVLTQIFPSVIYTVDRQLTLIPLYVFSIAANISFNYMFIKMGLGIEGVALGTSIAYFLFFLVVSGFAARYFTDLPTLLKTYFFIFLYFVYFLAVVVIIDRV
ncbi:MAG: oligosaccharide flippase family protein, partial [Candidatus Omnitrophica bacterium]|nr:oligosaccharide flippase family protein [Candidatus Omnitrophota bacterium]